MTTLRIKPEFANVLKDLEIESFTVDQLTEAYLASHNCQHSTKKSARQFVYRNMVRMMKVGSLVRQNENGRWPHYQLKSKIKPKRTSATSSSKPSDEKTENVNHLKALKDRLNQHKSSMLCALGEAEEYSDLCEQIPELKNQAQTLYNEARERSATLLGKVKALESLLSDGSLVRS